MGLNFRKSIKLGPARINLSKSGVGYSIGAGGLRYTKSPKRKTSKSKTAHKKTPATKSAAHTKSSFNEQREPIQIKRSWVKAIIIPIIGAIFVGGSSFVVAFILYAITSLFVPIEAGSLGPKLFVIGLPILLAVVTAAIAFFTWRPLPENKETDE